MLVAAACYARSSARFYNWLITHRLFGPIIRNYHEKGGISRRQKIVALSAMWFFICLSAAFGLEQWWSRTLLVTATAAASVFIVRLKTV